MANNTCDKRSDEDKEYDRVFPYEESNGRSIDSRRRIERLLELRRLKEMDDDIYWNKLH